MQRRQSFLAVAVVLMGLLALAAADRQSLPRAVLHHLRLALFQPPVNVGDRSRPMAVVKLDGSRTTLPLKAAVVEVFTTWCDSCRAELPVLRDASRRLRRQHVTFVALDQQEAPRYVQTFAQQNRIPYRIFIDDTAVTQEVYQAHLLPTFMIFDRSGKLRSRVSGPLSEEQLLAAAREMQ